MSGIRCIILFFDWLRTNGSAGQFRHGFEQAKRYVLVVFNNGFFADPVECGHGLFVVSFIFIAKQSARIFLVQLHSRRSHFSIPDHFVGIGKMIARIGRDSHAELMRSTQ